MSREPSIETIEKYTRMLRDVKRQLNANGCFNGGISGFYKKWSVNNNVGSALVRAGFVKRHSRTKYEWTGSTGDIGLYDGRTLVLATRDAQEWAMTKSRKGEGRDGLSPQNLIKLRALQRELVLERERLDKKIDQLTKIIS